jgi:hypothetical protein
MFGRVDPHDVDKRVLDELFDRLEVVYYRSLNIRHVQHVEKRQMNILRPSDMGFETSIPGRHNDGPEFPKYI